jgi:hypothetical protein
MQIARNRSAGACLVVGRGCGLSGKSSASGFFDHISEEFVNALEVVSTPVMAVPTLREKGFMVLDSYFFGTYA